MPSIEEWKERTEDMDSRKWLSNILTLIVLGATFLFGRQVAVWFAPAHLILTGMAFVMIYVLGNLFWMLYIKGSLIPQALKALFFGMIRAVFFLLLFPFRRKREPIAAVVEKTMTRHELAFLKSIRQKTSLFWICGLAIGGGLGLWLGAETQTPLISTTLRFGRLASQFEAEWMLDPQANLFWCTLIFMIAGWSYGFVIHRFYRTGYMPMMPFWSFLDSLTA